MLVRGCVLGGRAVGRVCWARCGLRMGAQAIAWRHRRDYEAAGFVMASHSRYQHFYDTKVFVPGLVSVV